MIVYAVLINNIVYKEKPYLVLSDGYFLNIEIQPIVHANNMYIHARRHKSDVCEALLSTLGTLKSKTCYFLRALSQKHHSPCGALNTFAKFEIKE